MPYPVLPPEMPPLVQDVAVTRETEPTAAEGDRPPEPNSTAPASVPLRRLGSLPPRPARSLRPGSLRDFRQQHRQDRRAADQLGPNRALIHIDRQVDPPNRQNPPRPQAEERTTATSNGKNPPAGLPPLRRWARPTRDQTTPPQLTQSTDRPSAANPGRLGGSTAVGSTTVGSTTEGSTTEGATVYAAQDPTNQPNAQGAGQQLRADNPDEDPLRNVPPLFPREGPGPVTEPPNGTEGPEIPPPEPATGDPPFPPRSSDQPPSPTDPQPTERPIDPDRPPQPVNAGDPNNSPNRTDRPGGGRPPRPELPNLPPGAIGAIEVTADRQEFDSVRQIFIAIGNVTMRYQGAVINADRLQVSLDNRIALAEGNVALTRGQQVIRGARMEYNLVQGDGSLFESYGEIFQPTTGEDFAPAEVITAGPYNPALDRPLSDRISANEPLRDVRQTGQFGLQVGTGNFGLLDPPPGQVGEVQNFRFQADRVDFDPNGWVAQNVRITNDPFSPPETEIRADRARLRRLSPLRDELIADRPRVVFDNRFTLPLLVRRTVIDRRERPPQPFEIRYDGEDRGGLYIQRQFDVIRTPRVRLRVTPQYLIQRALFDEQANGPIGLDVLGLQARLTAQLSPTTSLLGVVRAVTLDPDRFEDDFRGSVRLNQIIPTGWGPHSLTLEYSYRDRLFNGSFGFRTVQRSIGAVFASPQIRIGNTGFIANYQLGYQNINAQSDFADLIDEPSRNTDDRITLDRTQMAIAVARPIVLWRGEALPATPEAGLRYSPVALRPSIVLVPRLQMVWQNYSSGDYQNVLTGSIVLQGQLGHFSRPWLDYTAFTLGYIENWRHGSSPFLFDRVGDARVVVVGLTQQIYGPFRVGFQQVYNVDTGERIDSNYTLEYSRRTYGLLLRVDPERQSGSLQLRITDFNWTGSGQEFGDI
ncbi:DUF3769 domain-containing protein [Limnothrix sp. FACHB-708]|uniref:DUF3769 domain-containing protein n=1 Tax=unclassified Limnothrix TaxID=2632864 RepID=UPI001681DEBD|nr:MULTISPECIES: DUF3769 domain-containing protein [unclassified Limnothrix]MBD2554122.1 DUF3769 domain-containing protein [Limnothrix sp. FACHB-708]MBD2591004.1 DUF3769 domain-containing protein [Limnothrix sp. FACHB-406]